jgi:hypothetical protein
MDLNMYKPASRIPLPSPEGDGQPRSRSNERSSTGRARSKSPEHGSISAITPNLYVGDITASHSIPTLMHHGITAIVSLTKGPECAAPASPTPHT